MVNPREQPPLYTQPPLFEPSSDVKAPVRRLFVRDWDLLPAPEPWKSLQGERAGVAPFAFGMYMIMGGFMLLLACRTRDGFFLFMAISLMAGAFVVPIVLYIKWTDGMETWEIRLARSTKLCEAMEPAIDGMLAKKGYRCRPGVLHSAYKSETTLMPLGRNYIIRTVPGTPAFLAKTLALKAANYDVTLDFAFRPGSKYVSPYLTIELRDIKEQNYQYALGLQKDIVDTLEGLDYLSYQESG